MDKDTILDYVTETPGNTNRAVLSGMLDSMSGGGSSSSVIQLIFDSHRQQVGTNYTGAELLSMSRQQAYIPIQAHIQEENAGSTTLASSVWIGEARNDYGSKIGLSLIFITKGTGNVQFNAKEYYIPNNDTAIQYLRKLSFES